MFPPVERPPLLMSRLSLVHWIEDGAGARWLRRVAVLLAVAALSALVAYKQFHGPLSEETLRQANLGRALAEGHGFSSLANYPQVHAHLATRGLSFDANRLFPDLYQPPGYAIVIAAVLALLPNELADGLFTRAPVPPDGFRADYLLLGINVALLWFAAVQTWLLARRWFDPAIGTLATAGLLLSAAVWEQTVAVNGMPLVLVLLLGLFQSVTAGDAAPAEGRRAWPWWALSGAFTALLFLTDYPAGLLLPVVAGYAFWRGRTAAALIVLGVAVLVAAPWLIRNVTVSGHPLALAAQEAALRQGDPTADPAVARSTLSADRRPLRLPKLANKVLTAVETTLRERIWSGGGLVFTAFFVTGWLYRFRRDEVNRLRALFGVALLVLVLGQAAANSGEGERQAVAVASPLIIVFGAGFFGVLVAGRPALATRATLAAAGLLAIQAAPLAQNLLEPRGFHFRYPPYYPALFRGLSVEVERRGGKEPAWMADVPEGAAWYSGRRVWARPATLRDFYAIHAEQPLVALVLSPETLDRPFFSELTGGAGEAAGASRWGSWARIYRGLAQSQIGADFPLGQVQKVADNCYVLVDPHRVPAPVN